MSDLQHCKAASYRTTACTMIYSYRYAALSHPGAATIPSACAVSARGAAAACPTVPCPGRTFHRRVGRDAAAGSRDPHPASSKAARPLRSHLRSAPLM